MRSLHGNGECVWDGGLESLPVCLAVAWCSGKLRHGSVGSCERGCAWPEFIGAQQGRSRTAGHTAVAVDHPLGWGPTLASLVQRSQPQWGPEALNNGVSPIPFPVFLTPTCPRIFPVSLSTCSCPHVPIPIPFPVSLSPSCPGRVPTSLSSPHSQCPCPRAPLPMSLFPFPVSLPPACPHAFSVPAPHSSPHSQCLCPRPCSPVPIPFPSVPFPHAPVPILPHVPVPPLPSLPAPNLPHISSQSVSPSPSHVPVSLPAPHLRDPAVP